MKTYTPTTSGTVLERLAGALAVSTFSTCYFYAVLWLPAVGLLFFFVSRTAAAAALVPYVVSAVLPAKALPWLLNTWFFRCALKYHDFDEVAETSQEEITLIEKDKKIIFAAQPHGVMSITGICSAINMAPRPTPPTCTADVIRRIPIMKHVFGVFGLVGASGRSLTSTLRRTSVVLYVGGIAELFLSNPSEERLYVGKRKGFIKLAMQTGSEVIPCYYFGNTTCLEILRHPVLTSVSRKLGASITILWGRWGLPIPMPGKSLCVIGKPIGIPKKEFPSEEDVDKYHAVYVKEVKRIFDTYKTRLPDYKDKKIIIET
ncbi:unnamed protein product [Ectocarpus sp. CCAP 1310/34]|nr:unnamed protein product [Ectocarpus sp. CCAP 1310/34]